VSEADVDGDGLPLLSVTAFLFGARSMHTLRQFVLVNNVLTNQR
jgi:hypothetical protein